MAQWSLQNAIEQLYEVAHTLRQAGEHAQALPHPTPMVNRVLALAVQAAQVARELNPPVPSASTRNV
ncbi:hypothetical protein ABZ897_53825 [Nonomuraea sp. NPDC046802]|uniref:hypothetical protein n=1 Tax=Nonomuraea sp. NPDC046802 TaxID=3154919 RepID=UPI0033E77B55